MIKKTKSHIRIVKTAKALFFKHGISRITVEEICKEAGVSKMTFYRTFTNKNDVAIEVLEEMIAENMSKYRAVMQADTIPFPEKIKALVAMKFQDSNEMSDEFIQDIYQKEDKTLIKHLEVHSQNAMREFMQDLGAAQAKGWIRQDVHLPFLVYFMGKLNGFIQDEIFLSLYEHPQQGIMEITNLFFYGILEKFE